MTDQQGDSGEPVVLYPTMVGLDVEAALWNYRFYAVDPVEPEHYRATAQPPTRTHASSRLRPKCSRI